MTEYKTDSTGRPLTPRETEVARLLCAGYSNPGMAGKLGISRKTVETHLRCLALKCGVESRRGLNLRVRLAAALLHREELASR